MSGIIARASSLLLVLAALAGSARAQEPQRTTGGPPFRKGQIGVEFVRVGNGGGQLDFFTGVGFLWFRGPTRAWELDIEGSLLGGTQESPFDTTDVSSRFLRLSVGQRRYHRVADRAATFYAAGVSVGGSRSEQDQVGGTSTTSNTSVGLQGGLGATVWATAWLAFGVQYEATFDYTWGKTESDFQGIQNKTESSFWRVGLDGISVSGSLFF